MEMNLQPLAISCSVSGVPFAEGDRVMSFLVRSPMLEMARYDLTTAAAEGFAPAGNVVCRWAQLYKPRSDRENPERALKLNAENLFLTLADPATEPTPENARLVQFLALMLERKKVLRPRGRNAAGDKALWEHAKTKQVYELPATELTPEFFVSIQQQLSILVGEPKPASPAPAAPEPSPAPAAAASPGP